MAEKEKIYITHLVLHTRERRTTPSFSKVAEKGRFYSPLYNKTVVEKFSETASSNTRTAEIPLPLDLQERVNRGEVEIMIPTDGLYVFAGDDVHETIKHSEKKERIRLMHNGRTFHSK